MVAYVASRIMSISKKHRNNKDRARYQFVRHKPSDFVAFLHSFVGTLAIKQMQVAANF